MCFDFSATFENFPTDDFSNRGRNQVKINNVSRVHLQIVDVGVAQTGCGGPPCIKIGYSSRFVPRAEKGPPAMY